MSDKIEFETFQDSIYMLNNAKMSEPDCFNGMVFVKKYKITRELIIESDEVIIERLKKLYRETKNHHSRMALSAYARDNYKIDLYEECK